MSDFRHQIEEDIAEYQNLHKHIPNINKPEWAFNYWVLDKMFFEDEELIEEKIVDYHDLGIDAYEIYEDTKDIYLIQNKYYSDSSIISAEYVKNDFLIRAITALENGTYKKSDELQAAFNKYKKCDDFCVHLELFVTNNNTCVEANEYIKKFNLEHPKYHATIYYLNDIENKYYGEPEPVKKQITVKIETIVKGTALNINNESYKLQNIVDARYVYAPVVSLYRLYREAKEKNYPIFDKNIREYLGNKGVNKGIYQTLLDKNERKNFFYYNNGITIICDSMSKINTQANNLFSAYFTITNPQIVNGCQTVNSIYEALNNISIDQLETEFKDTFVMLKILEINRNNQMEDTLYKNIVKYNNSQNSIDEKTFIANTDIFIRLQKEFEKKGFLLLIKQSDKNKFSSTYKSTTKLRALNSERLKKFGLDETNKAKDVFIPLEKFLQVINAFADSGYTAYVKKSNMLKFGSQQYNTAIDFIKSNDITNDGLIDLYLLYVRSEMERKRKSDSRFPISYYLIDEFAIHECNNRQKSEITLALSSSDKIDRIIKLYTAVTRFYTTQYYKDNNIDYNKMIKRNINYDLLNSARDSFQSSFDD